MNNERGMKTLNGQVASRASYKTCMQKRFSKINFYY